MLQLMHAIPPRPDPRGYIFFYNRARQRRPIFSTPDEINLLRRIHSLQSNACHSQLVPASFCRTICTLSGHCPRRVVIIQPLRLIKSYFTRHWCAQEAASENTSRAHKGEKDVWQRRFWEHLIRDELDLADMWTTYITIPSSTAW